MNVSVIIVESKLQVGGDVTLANGFKKLIIWQMVIKQIAFDLIIYIFINYWNIFLPLKLRMENYK